MKKPEKNQDLNGIRTVTSATPVRCSTNWAVKLWTSPYSVYISLYEKMIAIFCSPVTFWLVHSFLSCQAQSSRTVKKKYTWRRFNKMPSQQQLVTKDRNFFYLDQYGFRPNAVGEFGSKSGCFWIHSPEWRKLNPHESDNVWMVNPLRAMQP